MEGLLQRTNKFAQDIDYKVNSNEGLEYLSFEDEKIRRAIDWQVIQNIKDHLRKTYKRRLVTRGVNYSLHISF